MEQEMTKQDLVDVVERLKQALTPAQQLKLKKQWYKKHPQRSSK